MDRARLRRAAWSRARWGFLAAAAFAGALPASAAAEQASQPASAAAGGLDVGRYHSCALLPSASVRCWGYGGDGSLGYGNKTTIGDDETPAAAGPVDLGAGRTAVALATGAVHTCAVLDDGAVRCWGFGGDGRLGNVGITSVGDDETPGSVAPVALGTGRTAKAIAAGREHTCAVLDDGSVRCWGYGFAGRLGYGDTNNIGDNETPGSVGPVQLGTGRTAKAITAGIFHTCALLDDGAVRCWGFGGNGQLGYGNPATIGDNETPDTAGPVQLGAGRSAVAISAGDFHTCAVLDDGSVRCWGYGGNGRLGYGNTKTVGVDETPDAVGPVDLGSGRTAVAISAGADHTCALLDNGAVRCWGYGGNGRLGYGNTNSIGDDETPGTVAPVDLGAGRTAVAISAGVDSTCARLDDGSVRCWGNGANGHLGYCNTTTIGDDETPAAAGPIDLGIPGSTGAGCQTTPPPPANNNPAPPPTPAIGSETGPSTPPPPSSDDPSAAHANAAVAALVQKIRADALRTCLREVSRHGQRPRRRARRRTARRRRSCRKRYGRTPGHVTTIAAKATGRHTIQLTFQAAGTDGKQPPAARRYLIKQSGRQIRSRRDFRRAHALCNGRCSFKITQIDTKITLTITDLRPRHTYYYAIAARDNLSGRTGPRSQAATARTR